MKKNIILCLFGILFLGFTVHGQDTSKVNIIDLKIQLLETKLELFQSKFSSFEKQFNDMTNKYSLYNYALQKRIDSLTQISNAQKDVSEIRDSLLLIPHRYKYSIKLNPERLFEGTFQLSYERAFSDNFSIDLAFLGTYVTKEGFGGDYMTKQELLYTDNGRSINYIGEMFSGFGVLFQSKFYLLTQEIQMNKSPVGLYVSPQLMYRNISISGIQNEYIDTAWVKKEITRYLNIGSFGTIIGYKFVFSKVLCIDIYVGGLMRLSKYSNESKTTKYKEWNNIDYSGILPTLGINFGIIK